MCRWEALKIIGTSLGKIKKLYKDESGAALAIALIVLMLLVILGTVVAFAANTEGRQSIRYSNKNQAYHLARSGAEIASIYIIENFTPAGDGVIDLEVIKNDITEEMRVDNTSDGITSLYFSENVITSKATVDGVEQEVKLELTGRKLPSIFDYAVFSMSDDILPLDKLNIETIHGDDDYLVGTNANQINTENIDEDKQVTDANISEDDLPLLDDNITWEVIDNIDSNRTIDLTGNNKYVEVEAINLQNNEFRVENNTGEGIENNILNILVTNEFRMQANAKITSDQYSSIIIYIDSSVESIEIQGSRHIELDAFIYAPYTNITLTGSPHFNSMGIIANKVINNGNLKHAKIIYDPDLLLNGAFSQESIDSIVEGSSVYIKGLWLY